MTNLYMIGAAIFSWKVGCIRREHAYTDVAWESAPVRFQKKVVYAFGPFRFSKHRVTA
jgi:hypothetical protein